jgi:hypothetical protein
MTVFGVIKSPPIPADILIEWLSSSRYARAGNAARTAR